MGINAFLSCLFESYYAAYLCSLPWRAVYFLQVHSVSLCLGISGTAYPAFKSPKEPSACMLRFVRNRMPSSERIRSNFSVCILEMFWKLVVSLLFLPTLSYCYSLSYNPFCMDSPCSPRIYRLSFGLHSPFYFSISLTWSAFSFFPFLHV